MTAVTAGKPHLAPPQNVTLLSRNFSVYLTWLPGPGYSQNVTYFVAYQSAPTPRRWRKVKKCAGTKELACPLMCLENQDLYNKFKGRVWAASPGARSPPAESQYLDYLFDVEPAPPVLVITRTEEVLRISATYQLPHCMPPPDLKYEVDFWKEGSRNKTRFPVTPHGQPVQIPLQPATSGHHCLSARTIYTFGDPKYSEFSKPTCFFLEAPGASWVFLVLLPLLLPLLLVTAIGYVVWKSLTENPWLRQAKMPWALDFTGHRHPVATFQPCDPESPDALILCPRKELTRRVRPSPSIRTPVTVQAGSQEDSAEEEMGEEEDTDDGVSFQPYIEPPPFLGRDQQTPGHPEAGDTWTPPIQVESSSATESSDRSWAGTEDSSPWDEPGSSCYLAKKGPDQGPGADGCQEPLLPEFAQDLSFPEDPMKDDLSSWTRCFSSPGLNLVPGEPPVSLHTLTFCWDSSPEEEEEEEEEGGGGGEGERESEIEDDVTGSWRAESLQKAEVRGGILGHYMAR